MACDFYLTISKLYFASVDSDSVDYYLTSGSTVLLSGDIEFNTIDFESASFTQKLVSDSKGTYYQKQFDLTLVDFNNLMFTGEQGIVIFEDGSGNLFITGMEQVFTLDKNDSTIAGTDNKVDVTLVQNSYLQFQRIDPDNFTLIN
jgi:hypothetical protein